ncbi:hypothetical protein, partial [Campylobacter jejuni]|uniref:hypothetical protein n=1 Tax=Campylobacter jejuni TaxID=197 RepID=UPI00352A0090
SLNFYEFKRGHPATPLILFQTPYLNLNFILSVSFIFKSFSKAKKGLKISKKRGKMFWVWCKMSLKKHIKKV